MDGLPAVQKRELTEDEKRLLSEPMIKNARRDDPVIVNRAVTGPPDGGKPPASPLAAIWRGIEAITGRLIALEARPLARNGIDGAAGKDGKDGEPGARGERGEPGAAGPHSEPGKDADPSVIRQIAAEEIAKALAALPAPEQRKRKTIVTKHDDKGRILEFVQEDV